MIRKVVPNLENPLLVMSPPKWNYHIARVLSSYILTPRISSKFSTTHRARTRSFVRESKFFVKNFARVHSSRPALVSWYPLRFSNPDERHVFLCPHKKRLSPFFLCAHQDSNLGPTEYQSIALANWAMRAYIKYLENIANIRLFNKKDLHLLPHEGIMKLLRISWFSIAILKRLWPSHFLF